MHDLPDWYREKHSKDLEDYWLALGEFTDAFAAIEAAMFDFLHKLSGTSNAVSRALFSGVRIDAAMKYITRLLVALKATDEEKQKAEFAFTQLDAAVEWDMVLKWNALVRGNIAWRRWP